MKNFLYPQVSPRLLPRMFAYALVGAILAGIYGVLHDQITYSISPEYFTRLKFSQFSYADFGWPRRVFVAEIGFLATWWVGFFAAWFLARVAVPALPPHASRRYIAAGFLIVFACGLAFGVAGYLLGIARDASPGDSDLAEMAAKLNVSDVAAFVRVAYIHNAGYLGGLVGLVTAIVYVQVCKRRRLSGARPSATR